MSKEHGVRRRRFLTPLACYPLLTTLHPLTTLLYTLHHATLTLPHPDPLTMLPYTLLQAAQTLAERVRLEMEVKAAELEARRQQDVVNRRAKEYAVSLKRAKKAELQLATAQNLLPFLRHATQGSNPGLAEPRQGSNPGLAESPDRPATHAFEPHLGWAGGSGRRRSGRWARSRRRRRSRWRPWRSCDARWISSSTPSIS